MAWGKEIYGNSSLSAQLSSDLKKYSKKKVYFFFFKNRGKKASMGNGLDGRQQGAFVIS